jgi:hypothetical protein
LDLTLDQALSASQLALLEAKFINIYNNLTLCKQLVNVSIAMDPVNDPYCFGGENLTHWMVLQGYCSACDNPVALFLSSDAGQRRTAKNLIPTKSASTGAKGGRSEAGLKDQNRCLGKGIATKSASIAWSQGCVLVPPC